MSSVTLPGILQSAAQPHSRALLPATGSLGSREPTLPRRRPALALSQQEVTSGPLEPLSDTEPGLCRALPPTAQLPGQMWKGTTLQTRVVGLSQHPEHAGSAGLADGHLQLLLLTGILGCGVNRGV